MHFVEPREHVFVHAITSECVVLSCEVDQEEAPVRWYKDGQEVEESDFVLLEVDGPHRRLVLPAAQPPDGGEFQCVAGEERVYFTVTITGGGLGGPQRGRKRGRVPLWEQLALSWPSQPWPPSPELMGPPDPALWSGSELSPTHGALLHMSLGKPCLLNSPEEKKGVQQG